jgi:hypothetical protein
MIEQLTFLRSDQLHKLVKKLVDRYRYKQIL